MTESKIPTTIAGSKSKNKTRKKVIKAKAKSILSIRRNFITFLGLADSNIALITIAARTVSGSH